MDDGFIRLSIFGIFLLGYLRSSEVVVVVVVVFFYRGFITKTSVAILV